MYEYASTLIRIREKKILSPNNLQRLLGATTAEQAWLTLQDTDYATETVSAPVNKYQQVLNQHLQHLKEDLAEMTENSLVNHWLFLEADLHNLKILFKQKYLTTNITVTTLNYGNFELTNLQKLIKQPPPEKIKIKWSELENTLEKYLVQSIDQKLKAESNLEASQISLIIDHIYWDLKLQLAVKSKLKFLKELTKLQIDQLNVLTFFRTKQLDLQDQTKLFIPGANLTRAQIKMILKGQIPTANKSKFFLEKFQFAQILKNKQPWLIEQQLQAQAREFIRQKAQHLAYGLPVVLNYFFHKLNADRNIRLILAAKLASVPTDNLQARLTIL